MDELIDSGRLPSSLRQYRQHYLATFDIETLEEKHQRDCSEIGTVTEAILKVVSIGVSSNIPGYGDKFFCRASSASKDGFDLVNNFLDHLFRMARSLQQHIPKEIHDAEVKLDKEIGPNKWANNKQFERKLQTYLLNFKKLSVFGFDSGK